MKRWGAIILVVMAVQLSAAFGQSAPEKRLIWGDRQQLGQISPTSLYWSFDSQSLYFEVQTNTPYTGYRYDLASEKLAETQFTQPTIELTTEQQTHFQAKSPVVYVAPDQNTFVYVSNYQIYSPGEGGFQVHLYAVGDLSLETFSLTRIKVYNRGAIRWSDDSSAFVTSYRTITNAQEIIIYAKNSSSTCFCNFNESFLTALNNDHAIYDLSANGEQILYPGLDDTLMYWDVNQHAKYSEITSRGELIPVEGVIGAAFDRDEWILLATSKGIVRYNLSSGETETVNSAAVGFEWAMFSPDNQWIAVLTDGYVTYRQLFILPVADN